MPADSSDTNHPGQMALPFDFCTAPFITTTRPASGVQQRLNASDNTGTLTKDPVKTAVSYQLVRSKRRTLAINVQKGQVIVRAPARASKALIQEFINEKTGWINNQVAQQEIQLGETFQIANGAGFCLLGTNCKIALAPPPTALQRQKSGISFDKYTLSIRPAITKLPVGVDIFEQWVVQAKMLFCRWLKVQASDYLLAGTYSCARALGLADNLGQVNYRYTRSKWGHCTSAGNIQYNPLIVLAPVYVVDYIIAHEVCHLRHRNHSKRFWEFVGNACPQWQRAEAWLDANGHRISFET